jgi:ADP-ribose pyrophosphatase YjhB (NUDIX family)
MDVVGQFDPSGPPVFQVALDHGADPEVATYDRGYVIGRPLEAVRRPDGEIELRLLVRPRSGEPRPPQLGRRQDAGLDLRDLADPEVRQRVAAYALVRSEEGVLATEFSARTAVPGHWGLPGGGIDAGEQPSAAVLREVAEETHQSITLGDLMTVQTSHWIGLSPRRTVEDYHAVRLVYAASCEHPTPPMVVDVGGTTESARWVPVDRWQSLPWTVGWRQILAEYLR